MPTNLRNTIEIQRPPEVVYRYVTQPWRWHEWHPNSRSATATVDPLRVGDTFDEVIELAPFSPLPVTLRRETHYRVLVAEPGHAWQARGETRDGWLEIRYDLERTDTGTRFTRALTYQTSGMSLLLMPLLQGRMAVKSRQALDTLRRKLEAGDDVAVT